MIGANRHPCGAIATETDTSAASRPRDVTRVMAFILGALARLTLVGVMDQRAVSAARAGKSGEAMHLPKARKKNLPGQHRVAKRSIEATARANR